jgi:hypothetical protein
MGRATYVCATCEENHHNRGEIVSLLEYLVGRSSHASNPLWYRRRSDKRIHNFGHATTVTNSVGDAFRHGALQREQQEQYQHQYLQQSLEEQERHHRQQQEQSLWASPAAIQDQCQDVLPYPTDRTFQSQPVSTSEDDQTTTLTQETILYHGRSSYRRQQACTPSSWEFPRDAFILGLMGSLGSALFKI